ncbi:winged helix-turn-helix transcriptional regulator [Priestia koreensis]|uniref:MarR family transcriptional regulator n=1 Tax=Priestia koreensis TaxID=284581 RepID=A0A0M0KQL5_9BACI|nr:helix-turn-helix domain-containing protein [Priestia koreensis]KOO41105.1 MarR family transcriptional regulator [Priestia koreensis]MCM3006055.1 helix-turn-helix transcriptional regulator [Priestia koreensis]UNL85394.1 helix-turn-helix transcriptional regulator [Priestia koreensis]
METRIDISNWDSHGYSCPVEATLDIIGGKWKSVILYHLTYQELRFNELKRLVPGVTQRMLTLQLRELEKDGIIHREVYKQVPPKVEYSLTDFGRTLTPIIQLMLKWGVENTDKIVQHREQAEAE